MAVRPVAASIQIDTTAYRSIDAVNANRLPPHWSLPPALVARFPVPAVDSCYKCSRPATHWLFECTKQITTWSKYCVIREFIPSGSLVFVCNRILVTTIKRLTPFGCLFHKLPDCDTEYSISPVHIIHFQRGVPQRMRTTWKGDNKVSLSISLYICGWEWQCRYGGTWLGHNSVTDSWNIFPFQVRSHQIIHTIVAHIKMFAVT